MKEEEEPFFFLVASSPSCPGDLWSPGRLFALTLAHSRFISITTGQQREWRRRGAGARGQFANWLAGICIYSTRQNVTTGLGDDLCVLLAKQSDEGNLSCGSRSAQHGRPRPLLLASSVTCHTAVGTDRGMPTGGEERGELKRRRCWGTRGQEGRREEATCQEVFTAESAASICLVFN